MLFFFTQLENRTAVALKCLKPYSLQNNLQLLLINVKKTNKYNKHIKILNNPGQRQNLTKYPFWVRR